MKFFGYVGTAELGPAELNEVTISANPSELRALSDFFLRCAAEIEANPIGWEHEHFPGSESLVVAKSNEG